MTSAPSVFLSYSWDDPTHKDWVRRLATELQSHGVLVFLDQWDAHPGIDLPAYMERCVREADFVVLVCTPHFRARADVGRGGVGYEKGVVTGEIFGGSPKPGKFVPVLRAGSPADSLPSYLKSKAYVDFRDDKSFPGSLEDLLRHVHAAPRYIRPNIGSKPDLPSAQDAAKLSGPPAGGISYCTACGREPGSYSSCLGGNAHSFRRFPGPKESIFCSMCGRGPGSYSSCLGGNAHGYRQYSGPSTAVRCAKCGTTAGSYSSCLGGEAHAFELL